MSPVSCGARIVAVHKGPIKRVVAVVRVVVEVLLCAVIDYRHSATRQQECERLMQTVLVVVDREEALTVVIVDKGHKIVHLQKVRSFLGEHSVDLVEAVVAGKYVVD